MHKNSPGIRRVACRDDAYSDSSSLRPRAHTHARTHTEIQSLGWEYTRSLGVNRFGIAGTQRSRKKTYSIPITRLIRPNPRASILRRGRQSRFPFYRVYDGRWIHPFCARTVATTLPVFATQSSISSLHTRNPGIPAKSALFLAIRLAIRRAISPRVFASSSSSYSSSATSSRLPLPPPPPVHVQGFLKTYYRRQPDRASFLPFCWPSRTSAGLQSSNHPIDLPRLAPSSHPCRSFLYTRTTTASPQWSRTFHPFRASTARLATLHFSPSSAPSNLSPFSRLVASLRRVYSAK